MTIKKQYNKLTHRTIQRIFELNEKHLSLGEIASILEISKSTVKKYLDSFQLKETQRSVDKNKERKIK